MPLLRQRTSADVSLLNTLAEWQESLVQLNEKERDGGTEGKKSVLECRHERAREYLYR